MLQRSRPKVEKFYKSKVWKDCRNGYMSSKYYICERCNQAAEICHHKKYITIDNIDDPKISLNWDNLEALCRDCHNKEHFQKEDVFVFDDEGNLISYK